MSIPTQPCRFAEADPAHVCMAYDGGPVRPHGICHHEARMQVREEAIAQGRSPEPTPAQTERVAEILRSARRVAS